MQNDRRRTTLSGQRFPLGSADPFSAILRPFLWAGRREEIAVSTISEDVSDAGFKVAVYVGFPAAQHKPTELRQGFIYILVALDVAGEFLFPICLSRCDLFSGVVLVPSCMPKIAIHKDGDLAARQGDVRGSWKRPPVFPIAHPPVPKRLAKQDFRLRVVAFDPLHDLSTFFLGNIVHAYEGCALQRGDSSVQS